MANADRSPRARQPPPGRVHAARSRGTWRRDAGRARWAPAVRARRGRGGRAPKRPGGSERIRRVRAGRSGVRARLPAKRNCEVMWKSEPGASPDGSHWAERRGRSTTWKCAPAAPSAPRPAPRGPARAGSRALPHAERAHNFSLLARKPAPRVPAAGGGRGVERRPPRRARSPPRARRPGQRAGACRQDAEEAPAGCLSAEAYLRSGPGAVLQSVSVTNGCFPWEEEGARAKGSAWAACLPVTARASRGRSLVLL